MTLEPLYIQILNQLKTQINNHQIKVGDKLPTEQELSKEYNVSRITAKRVLTELENEGFIIRKRGLGSFLIQTSDDIENTKNNSAKQKNLLFLVPFFDEDGFGDYASGIAQVAESAGFIFLVQQIESIREVSANELQKKYEGIIFCPPNHTNLIELFYELYLDNFPVVFLEKILDGIPYSTVTANNFKGSYEATRHLIQQKHQNILFISNEFYSSTSRDRHLGYIKAMHDHSLERQQLFQWQEPLSDSSDSPLLDELVHYIFTHDITAIIAENDWLAILLMQQLRSFELHIPDDLSIIGFDNIPAAHLLSPALTTVALPLIDMGTTAAHLLLEKIENPKSPSQHRTLPTNLIVRESVEHMSKKQNKQHDEKWL